jgi:hypothetical protein
MPVYTPQQLSNRYNIFQSQTQIVSFLNKDILNALINLFDDSNIDGDKITKYIEDERKARNLNPNIHIISEVNLKNEKDPTLHLGIKDINNNEILHFSIHLALGAINPKFTGIIHISKNIYKIKSIPKPEKKLLYALISVKQPIHKPHSLEFSIDDGYTTTGVKNAQLYDPELQQEMDVIIDVLNKIFDETNPNFYIGRQQYIYPVYLKINSILETLNNHTKYATRKNKGNMIIPTMNNKHCTHNKKNKHKIKTNKYTRKIHK